MLTKVKLYIVFSLFILLSLTPINATTGGDSFDEISEVKTQIETNDRVIKFENNNNEAVNIITPVTEITQVIDHSDGQVEIIKKTSVTVYFDKETDEPVNPNVRGVGGNDSSYSAYAEINSHLFFNGNLVAVTGVDGFYVLKEPSVRCWGQFVECGQTSGFDKQYISFNPTGTSFNYNTGFHTSSKLMAVYGSKYTVTLGRNSASMTWSFTVDDTVVN